MPWNKPLPNVDADIQPFWDGLKEHRFLLFRCKRCGEHYWPAAFCRNHPNEPFFGNLEWADASGRGKVFTFNVHHIAFHPGFQEDIPYVYALIELDEGPLFGTNLIDCDPADVHIGMPVEVAYRDVPEIGYTLPYFRPCR